MNGWWDKPPLATEDVMLREDLRVKVTQQAASRPAQRATFENRPGATGLLVTPAEGQAPLYE